MVGKPKCSICGKSGHNSRTCSEGGQSSNAVADHVLWIKFDNVTTVQADDLLKSAISSKTEIAPEGRATFAKGAARDMPARIKEALSIESEDISNEQKEIK